MLYFFELIQSLITAGLNQKFNTFRFIDPMSMSLNIFLVELFVVDGINSKYYNYLFVAY